MKSVAIKPDILAVDQVVTDHYAIYQGDSCELINAVPDNSVHFGIHSPPFEGLYKFSNSLRDISNSKQRQFWEHYDYLIAGMKRITMPGRIHAVHVMQLPTSKGRDGKIGMRDFRGEVVRAYSGDEAADLYEAMRRVRLRALLAKEAGETKRHAALIDAADRIEDDLTRHPGDKGWIFHSEVQIWKDPVAAQHRSKSIRLLHKQVVKDSAISGQGLSDFIVSFRKPGDNAEPVAGCFRRYVGDGEGPDYAKYTTDQDARNWYSIEVWQRYASPVWMDITQSDTLKFRMARDEKDEQHIAPLQISVIERCIDLWSNPGDIVFTPFLGIGSEVYGALRSGRRGLGFELKESYFKQARRNVAAAVSDVPQSDLFAEPADASDSEDEEAA